MTESGIGASVKTSAAHNSEAQQLLDSSGGGGTAKKIAADSCLSNDGCCCCCQECEQADIYPPPNVDHHHHPYYYATEQPQEQQETPARPHDPIESMSLEAQSIRLLPAYFVSELTGTYILMLIGDGSLASYILLKRPPDTFKVSLAFGIAAMISTYLSSRISGAHLNPAATLAFAIDGRLKWELVPVYMIAQYIGSFMATLTLFIIHFEAITDFDGGNRSTYGTDTATGNVFTTYPAPFVSVAGSLIDQIVGTALLLFSIAALVDKNNLALEDRFQPPFVAFALGLFCIAFSVNCGATFNPARDLSPRLLTALLGYPGVWDPIDGTYWYVAGIIGPHIGAIIGVYLYKYLISTAVYVSQRHLQILAELKAAKGIKQGTTSDISHW